MIAPKGFLGWGKIIIMPSGMGRDILILFVLLLEV
jgi:hypothetical protein